MWNIPGLAIFIPNEPHKNIRFSVTDITPYPDISMSISLQALVNCFYASESCNLSISFNFSKKMQKSNRKFLKCMEINFARP